MFTSVGGLNLGNTVSIETVLQFSKCQLASCLTLTDAQRSLSLLKQTCQITGSGVLSGSCPLLTFSGHVLPGLCDCAG